jgi:HEAT repeat protein
MAIDQTLLLAALKGSDVVAQNDAIADAIRVGAQAVPILLSLWSEPGIARSQVMFALERIGDARAAEVFEAGVQDIDEHVRAYAARGLSRIGHPEAMTALLATLDDAADPLHLDVTPSVGAITTFGLAAVPALLDRMASEDSMSRLHAQRALQLIVSAHSNSDEKAAGALWQRNGSYDWEAADDQRRASIKSWTKWLKEERK